MKPASMYQIAWLVSLFAPLCLSQPVTECHHFDGCLCFRLVEGVGLVCQGPNVTLSEICGICDQLDDTLIFLEVRDTILTTISDNCFRECGGLVTLSLQNTGLSYSENNSFQNLHSLINLNLDNNRLVHECEFVNPSAFASLYNLRKLSLQHNIDGFKCEDGKKILANLPSDALANLKEIHMDGVYQVQFGRNFRNYKNLTHITLSGHYSNYSIFSLNNKTFENLPSLTHADLSNCNITNIDAGAFENQN